MRTGPPQSIARLLRALLPALQDSLAEWSKALASGASPQGRGFEPHSCHFVGSWRRWLRPFVPRHLLLLRQRLSATPRHVICPSCAALVPHVGSPCRFDSLSCCSARPWRPWCLALALLCRFGSSACCSPRLSCFTRFSLRLRCLPCSFAKLGFWQLLRGAPAMAETTRATKMDTLGIEPRASRMLSGCDTTTPCARLLSKSCRCQLQSQNYVPICGQLVSRLLCTKTRTVRRLANTKKRRRGGIEPLHVSMPRELKSRPGTSPTHPGRDRGQQLSSKTARAM